MPIRQELRISKMEDKRDLNTHYISIELKYQISIYMSVEQAGSERTEAGESALPAEESPSAGTGRAQTLRNLQENIIDFIMGAGGETSLYLP